MRDEYYKGKAALVDRFGHAFRGVGYAWKREPNFKIETGIAVLVLSVMAVLPLSFVERAVLVLIITLVLTLEVVNSVFERMLDLIHPKFSPEVKHIKDTLAGAVLLSSLASLVIGGFILAPAFLAYDATVNQWILNIDAPSLFIIAKTLTLLGSWQLILGLVLILSPWLLYKKRHEILSLLLGSVVVGEMIVLILKNFFERARPAFVNLDGLSGASFPSGHALVGAAFWLTVGYILTGYSTKRKYLWTGIGIIILLVALSRVILSVHWLSDVVAGLLLGTVWFLLWFGINKKLFRR